MLYARCSSLSKPYSISSLFSSEEQEAVNPIVAMYRRKQEHCICRAEMFNEHDSDTPRGSTEMAGDACGGDDSVASAKGFSAYMSVAGRNHRYKKLAGVGESEDGRGYGGEKEAGGVPGSGSSLAAMSVMAGAQEGDRSQGWNS